MRRLLPLLLLLIPLAVGCAGLPLFGPPQQAPPTGVQQVQQAHQTFDLIVTGLTLARTAKVIDDDSYRVIDPYVQAGAKALADLDAHATAEPLTLNQYLLAACKAFGDIQTQHAAAVVKPKAKAAAKPAAKKPAAKRPATRPAAPVPAPSPPPADVEEGPPPESLPDPARQPVSWYVAT